MEGITNYIYLLKFSIKIKLEVMLWFIHRSTSYALFLQLYQHDHAPDATKSRLKSYYGLYIENCAESCPADCVFKNAKWKSLDEEHYNIFTKGLSMPGCVDEKKATAVKNDLAVSKDYYRGNDAFRHMS